LVLGCTHYPFLRPLIRQIVGPDIEIIDPAPAVARQAGRVLVQHGWLVDSEPPAQHRFYTTGDPERFTTALLSLLGLSSEVRYAVWHEDGRLTTVPI